MEFWGVHKSLESFLEMSWGLKEKREVRGIRGSWFKKLVQAKTNNKNIYIKKVPVEEILKIKI